MKLERVTMTGADDTIDARDLIAISKEFPFVEWGVLLSAGSRGSSRFPSLNWLATLYSERLDYPHMNLCFHVCGSWVRSICAGNWTPLFTNTGRILDFGQRVQLNFHSYTHLLSPGFIASAKSRSQEQGWQVIFQCDGVNDHLVTEARASGLDAVPLFDKSGGAGIVPGEWPKAIPGVFCGYAGGLGPDNLTEELGRINAAAGDQPIWIDMETKIRNDRDVFDLNLVRKCLEQVTPMVSASAS